MSLKVIEMQIALPRTQDAGRIQEQMQQRSQIQQDQAAYEVQKEAKKKLHSVMKEERKQSAQFHEKEGNPDKGPFFKQNKKKKATGQSQYHPYKGQAIDYSG